MEITADQGEAQVGERVQQHVGRHRGIGSARRIVLVQVRAKIEVGKADVSQRSAVAECVDRHDVLELRAVAVPRIFVAGAVVFPLVAPVQVGRQIDPRMGVDVGAQAAVQRVGAVLFAAAVIVDPVERHVKVSYHPWAHIVRRYHGH